ncbi:hypothetical protein SALBM135S_09442 [Streptomyces alboniger]
MTDSGPPADARAEVSEQLHRLVVAGEPEAEAEDGPADI